ncbi:hypothetical protein EE612_041889, partial [Oryza sativa]
EALSPHHEENCSGK